VSTFGEAVARHLAPCRCGHPGLGCDCYLERLAEAKQNGPQVEESVEKLPEDLPRSSPKQVTWYLATCVDCKPMLPQPFTERANRDEWASVHSDAVRHTVAIATQERSQR
jgi:hypothetical protein